MLNWRGCMAALGMALAAASASAMAFQATAPAAPAPLTLSASCTGSGQAAALHVRIANKSDREVAFVFGRTFGPTNVIDALSVLTIRPATGATEGYPYVNPKHASLTGRATPWIIKVPAGGVHELDAPVEHFISGMTYTLLDPAAVPGTRLQFEGRPAGSVKVWTGTIEVPIDC